MINKHKKIITQKIKQDPKITASKRAKKKFFFGAHVSLSTIKNYLKNSSYHGQAASQIYFVTK